jgi:hypothetical protein
MNLLKFKDIVKEIQSKLPQITEASYIVYREGDTYHAKNGRTGQIEFSSTDASIVIQSVVDAVNNAGGGRIFIKKGIYDIGAPIKPKSNVVIEAEDSINTVFNLSQPFIFQALGEPEVENFAVINGRFIIKSDIRVMWFRETTRNIVIKGCRLEIDPSIGTYSTSFGIRFEGADNVVIDSVVIDGAGMDTVQLDGTKVVVMNSYLDGKLNFANGIYSGATELFVLNNRFIGWKHNGIMLTGTSSRIAIVGNYFYNCADGVDHDGSVDSEVIAFNVFHDCSAGGDACISLTPISPNVVRNVTIVGNVFRQVNSNLVAVYIASSEHVVVEANVFQNNIYLHNYFVNVRNSKYVHVKNNAIYLPYYGGVHDGVILITDSNYVYVEGNTIVGGPDNRWAIIKVASSDVGATSWLFIRRNYLRPNIYGSPDRESSGIVFADLNATNVFIEDNVFDFGLKDRLIVSPPPGTVIRRNAGYPTEASGVATIVAGSTRVTVSHGLVKAPSKVLVTPYANIRTWVENITDTSFDIVTDVTPTTDVNVAWYVEI